MRFSLILTLTLPALAAELPELLARFNRLAAAGDYEQAEDVAREAMRLYPESRDGRLALANVLLWEGKYREAARRFRELVTRDSGDRESRLGLANALYWSGHYRDAEREYALIADHPDAARSLAEIRAARPGVRLTSSYRSDDQPFRVALAEAAGFVFSNPLTRFEAAAGTWHFAGDGKGDAPYVRVAAETTHPPLAITLRGSATLLRFADGETRPMGMVAADRRLGKTTVTLAASRRELFGSARSTDAHPFADSVELRWHRADASLRAEAIRYFDANRGVAADAWFLVPLGRVSAGASVAYRDSDQSRFTAQGEYDPYWTPIDLREARLIVTASRAIGRATAGLHVDGGIAREQQNGTFNPWRATLSLSIPFRGAAIGIEAERQSTVFYSANEIRASVAGRF